MAPPMYAVPNDYHNPDRLSRTLPSPRKIHNRLIKMLRNVSHAIPQLRPLSPRPFRGDVLPTPNHPARRKPPCLPRYGSTTTCLHHASLTRGLIGSQELPLVQGRGLKLEYTNLCRALNGLPLEGRGLKLPCCAYASGYVGLPFVQGRGLKRVFERSGKGRRLMGQAQEFRPVPRSQRSTMRMD